MHRAHVELDINHSSVIRTADITLGKAAQYPLVHVDYIKQYAAQLEYIRRTCTSFPHG